LDEICLLKKVLAYYNATSIQGLLMLQVLFIRHPNRSEPMTIEKFLNIDLQKKDWHCSIIDIAGKIIMIYLDLLEEFENIMNDL